MNPLLSLHQRKLRYDEARKRIFNGFSSSEKIKKCRERFRKRRAYSKVIASTVIDEVNDNRPYAKVRLG